MGSFLMKVIMEKLKVHSPKKRKRSKYTRSQFRVQPEQPKPRRWCPADIMYRGPPLPDVVGLAAPEAERRIRERCPELYCEVIRPNQLRTMCYRTRRVRLMVDRYNKVEEAPSIG